MARYTTSEWDAFQLRLTAFPIIPFTLPLDMKWWELVTGVAPEEIASNVKQGVASAGGPFGEGGLVLQIQPDRIDWVMQPKAVDMGELLVEPRIVAIGRFQNAFDSFRDAIRKWLSLDSLPAIGRLAYGAVLQHAEKSREEGYLRLRDYVPVQISPDSQDFLYQINRPIVSASEPDLRINRLSKWSVSRSNLGRLTADLTTGHSQSQSISSLYALRLELDINSVPRLGPELPKTKLGALFDEFVDLGMDIIEKGDQVE